EMAVRIIDNAKTQRPSVCNAIEGLIVHKDVAAEILPRVQAAFRSHDVTIYGDEKTREILGDAVQPVTEELYDTEFNDYKITVKVADSLEDAMAHIAKYSTKHSECIITRDLDVAQKFQRTVDAAVVCERLHPVHRRRRIRLRRRDRHFHQKLRRGPMGLHG
ncbi:MAG: gamma-glutamyl-phosphate reductase, partial [Ruminococcus sp.]